MPEEEYFEEGLYTIDIGHNDLAEGLYSNMSVEQVNATVPDIIRNISAHVKVTVPLVQILSFKFQPCGLLNRSDLVIVPSLSPMSKHRGFI